ncbi:MAG: hypothetical protein OEX02_10725, partial [Cyclobacteriaceae bacterium]|nr:hypothetical protein [Cyclobacteriaceae bacterium]
MNLKHSYALLIVLLFNLSAYTQSVTPEHEKKTLVSEDGKIYWNKNLPVYITLSTSTNGEGGHVINTDEQNSPDPYYFDTEGTNWIRTRWAVDKETGKTIYPLEEVLWPIEVDGKAPVTTPEFISEGKTIVKGVTYYSGDLKLKLTARDEVSGVANIYYSKDAMYLPYTEEIPLDIEKEWFISFYAVDKVGNAESIDRDKDGISSENLFSFKVDKTAPTTTHKIIDPNENNTLAPKSKITLSSEDTGAGLKRITYSMDSGAEKVYGGSISLYSLPEGAHQITYHAEDLVKNKEETKSYDFYLDRTAPDISVNIEGDQFTSSTNRLFISPRSKIKLTGSDNKAGVGSMYYKLDTEAYSEYQQPIEASQNAGPHTLYYYGIDLVENKSVAKSTKYYIDVNAPAIKYNVTGPKYVRKDTLFVRSITAFTITPYEKGDYQSGIKDITYNLNDGTQTTYDGKFNIQGDGLKNLSIEVSDQVENSANLKQVVFLDNEAPEIKVSYSVEQIGKKTVREEQYDIYPSEVQVYLAATDKHVGTNRIYYAINGGAEKLYTGPVRYFKNGTNIDLKVRSIDHLENESTKTIVFS